MVDSQRLIGIIYERGMSQRKVAKSLGMTDKTFYCKMKRGVFGSDEIEQMIRILDIHNPMEVFFAEIGA